MCWHRETGYTSVSSPTTLPYHSTHVPPISRFFVSCRLSPKGAFEMLFKFLGSCCAVLCVTDIVLFVSFDFFVVVCSPRPFFLSLFEEGLVLSFPSFFFFLFSS